MSLEKLLRQLDTQKVAKASELMTITNRSQLRRYVEDGLIKLLAMGFTPTPPSIRSMLISWWLRYTTLVPWSLIGRHIMFIG